MSETLFPPTGLTLFEIQIKGSNYVKERHNSLHSSCPMLIMLSRLQQDIT